MDGALISVGGPPTGTVIATLTRHGGPRSRRVFLGAVRLARALAPELGDEGHCAATGSISGAAATGT